MKGFRIRKPTCPYGTPGINFALVEEVVTSSEVAECGFCPMRGDEGEKGKNNDAH
jgi:hypothetical protein